MYCDKKDHLIGKVILGNYKIKKKLEEIWLIKIFTCINLSKNEEYIIKLVRFLLLK